MKKSLLFFLILIIVSLSLSSIQLSKSAPNYNWLQNHSFEQSLNLIEDYSFESGDDLAGVIYGNFTNQGGNYTTDSSNTGSWSYRTDGLTEVLWYNFSSGYYFLGTDLTSFSIYVYNISANGGIDGTWYYSDGTTDSWTVFVLPNHTPTEYYLVDIVTDLNATPNPLKTVVAFSIFGNNSVWLDDVFLIVDNGESQTTIAQNTYPWFCPYGGTYVFNNTISYNLNYSVRGNPNAVPANFWNGLSYPPIAQSVNGLESDYVVAFHIWGYCLSNYEYSSVRGYIWFTDGSFVSKSVNFNAETTWQLFNFMSLITTNPDKTILSVGFVQESYGSGYSGYVFLDDAYLTATIPYSSGIFSFTLTPSPITYDLGSVTGYGFHAYANLNYIFNGYLTDNTNGTFQVDSDFAIAVGNVTNGQLTFSISSRTSKGLTSAYEEQFLIQIDDNVTIRVYSVLGNWVIPTVTPTTTTATEQANMFYVGLPILIVFGLFTIPSMYYLGIAGLIAGFDISAIVCFWIGITPSWSIAVVVLINIVLLYFKMSGHEIRHKANDTEIDE